MFPFLIQNSNILKLLNINFLVLGVLVLTKEEITNEEFRKSLIYYQQYKETLFLGFLFIFLFELIVNFIFYNSLSLSNSFKNIKFVKEVNLNEKNRVYLLRREKFVWIYYWFTLFYRHCKVLRGLQVLVYYCSYFLY